jgi:hypothetical protein
LVVPRSIPIILLIADSPPESLGRHRLAWVPYARVILYIECIFVKYFDNVYLSCLYCFARSLFLAARFDSFFRCHALPLTSSPNPCFPHFIDMIIFTESLILHGWKTFLSAAG